MIATHKDNYDLSDVFGKITNTYIEGEKWKGKAHFDQDRITPTKISQLKYGSLGFRRIKSIDGTQTNIVPTHFAMRPQLVPRVPNAGLNDELEAVFFMDITEPNPQEDELMPEDKARIAELEKQLAACKAAKKTASDALTRRDEEDKQVLTKEILAYKKHQGDELKDLSVDELRATKATLALIKPKPPEKDRLDELGKANHGADYFKALKIHKSGGTI